MGRAAVAEPIHAKLPPHDECARQQRLARHANDRRGGDAHGLERAREASRLSGLARLLNRRLQGRAPDAAPLEPAAAAADPAFGWPHGRLLLPAGRLSAPDERARHAGPRQARNEMQAAMMRDAPSPALPRFTGEGADTGLHDRRRLRRPYPLPRNGGGLGRVLITLAALSLLFAPAPAQAFLAYVSNEKGNSVTVIDTEKLEAVNTVKVGRRPRGLALTKDGSELFICAGDDDAIQVLDTKTLQITGRLPSGPDPELMALSPDGKTVYVSNENDNLVTMIDVATKRQTGDVPVGVEPEGMAVSPDGKILVNTSETTNMAHMIDTHTKEIVANILVDARPRFAEFKPDGSELWVSSEVGGTVAVIDPVKHVVKQKISFEISGLSKEAIQPIGIS